jgi:hypothetical protein
MSFVMNWIQEVQRLLAQAREQNSGTLSQEWHDAVEKILKPTPDKSLS